MLMRLKLGVLVLLSGAVVISCTGASRVGQGAIGDDLPAEDSTPTAVAADFPDPVPSPDCGDSMSSFTTSRMNDRSVTTFDGSPAQPTTVCGVKNWDIQIHSRDDWAQLELETMDAAHGPDCGAPPASHQTHTYEGAVFSCRNHVMTAMDATGYGVIYLTPDALVDFSTGEAVISWDMSTLRSSNRDWIDVWVTPWADNKALPLEDWLPDLTGNPRNAIHVRMDGSGTSGPLDGRFRLLAITDGVEEDLGLSANYDDFLTQDGARRDTFELRISAGRVRLSMPQYGKVLLDEQIPTLTWSEGIVQFGHHSYNPTKDGFAPGTWHWDNVSIEPAVPFQMVKADTRYTNNGIVTFDSPAPANAFLRFGAQGGLVEIDDGTGFRRVDAQSDGDGFRVASFFTPITEGATSVTIRMTKASSWFNGPYFAKDFAIWSK